MLKNRLFAWASVCVLVLASLPVQAAAAWTPTPDGLLDWAETVFPNLFPGPQRDRLIGAFTYRFYPLTGNYVGAAGDTVYIAGPVAGNAVRPVGKMADFACAINPGCTAATTLQPVAAQVSPELRANTVVSGISAQITFPARISGEVLQGESLPSTSVVIGASGDLRQLSGRTLYILVVDPHGLFVSSARAAVSSAPSSTTASVSIALTANPLTTVGLLEGTVKVYACLDTSCSTQFSGSPYSVPYSVKVWSGLTIDSQAVTVSSAFAQSATRELRVQLPANTTSWDILVMGTSALDPPFSAGSSRLWGNTTGTVQLYFRMAAPGTYRGTLRVSGYATAPGGSEFSFLKELPITYTVTPTAAPDYVIEPAETLVHCLHNLCDNFAVARYAAANAGSTLVIGTNGIGGDAEYLTAPPAAAGMRLATAWWSEDRHVATICGSSCLPPGTYTARVRYTLTRGGVTGTVYHPIRMIIDP